MINSSTLLKILAGCCGLSLALTALPAAAQDSEESQRRGWLVSIGGGIESYPKYPGADSYGLYPRPIITWRREGTRLPFEGPDDGLDLGLLADDSRFNLGPVVSFQNKRDEEDVGAPVGEVDFTVEAGGFVELFPLENFRLRADLRKGIGGHDGMIGEVGADIVFRDEFTHVFSIGPRARWANRTYHRAYFGVTPGVAAATGLAPFEPESGLYAVGVTAGYTQMLGRDWGLQAYAGYDRLVGDAADSPIVRTLGSRSQFSGGVGLFYNFTVGR